jgi:hypothetical protein
MLHNAGEKEIRLDGTQCLKRKGTKKRQEAYKRRKEQQLRIKTTNGCIVQMLVNNNIDITIDVSHMCYVTIGRWSGCIKQGKYGS